MAVVWSTGLTSGATPPPRRDSDRPEHVDVEVVGPDQQLVHPLEEQPRLGSLDDAVVVGRRDGDDLGQARGWPGWRDPPPRTRWGTRGCPRPRWCPGRASGGAPTGGCRCARVGQAHRDPGEVVGAQLVGADLADQVLVGRPEARKSRVSASRMHGTMRVVHWPARRRRPSPSPMWSWCTTRACRRGRPRSSSSSPACLGDGPDHGVADEVSEADLAATVRPGSR